MTIDSKIEKYLNEANLSKTEQKIMDMLKSAKRYKGKKRVQVFGKQQYKAAYKLADKGYVDVIDASSTKKSDYRDIFGGIGGKSHHISSAFVVLKE